MVKHINTTPKIVCCMIGQDVEDYIEMSINAIKDYVDKIVFVDGGSTDSTLEILDKYGFDVSEKSDYVLIQRPFEHDHPGANGRARNCYLEFIKKNFPDYWCIVIDPDEIIEGGNLLKGMLEKTETQENNDTVLLFHPRMIHYIYTFGTEDATLERHYVKSRIFKITEGLYYPETEHNVLQYKGEKEIKRWNLEGLVYFHLAYVGGLFNILKRYKNHLKKSEIHSKEELKEWYYRHLFNEFPIRKISPIYLPHVVRDKFLIKDLDEEYYFRDRNALELKHFADAIHWKKYFNPKNVIIVGCGWAQRVYTLRTYEIDAVGFDKCKWLIDKLKKDDDIKKHVWCGDILTEKHVKDYDLVVAYDVLEHIDYFDIDVALKNVYELGSKNYIFSIPFKGNKDLDNDPTHRIKEDKEWWLDKLKKHKFKIKETPNNFMYKEQIVVAER